LPSHRRRLVIITLLLSSEISISSLRSTTIKGLELQPGVSGLGRLHPRPPRPSCMAPSAKLATTDQNTTLKDTCKLPVAQSTPFDPSLLTATSLTLAGRVATIMQPLHNVRCRLAVCLFAFAFTNIKLLLVPPQCGIRILKVSKLRNMSLVPILQNQKIMMPGVMFSKQQPKYLFETPSVLRSARAATYIHIPEKRNTSPLAQSKQEKEKREGEHRILAQYMKCHRVLQYPCQ
jgi:hypothetical protein